MAGNIKCVALTQTSDARLKKDAEPVAAAVRAISQLRAVQYKWKETTKPHSGFDDRQHLGLIAQEVEQVLPQAVSTALDGTKSLNYSMLISALVEAIKAQQREIENLKTQVNSLTTGK